MRKKVVGVGEIGLDYYHNDLNKDKQKALFIKQIEIAKNIISQLLFTIVS